MDLLSEIPGLSIHKTAAAVAPAPVIVGFDDEAASNIIRAAIVEVGSSYPGPNAWGWLADNRPDVITELKKSGKAMNLACDALDIGAVKMAADRFVRLHQRAWQLYEQRPPVVEVQAPLFSEAA